MFFLRLRALFFLLFLVFVLEFNSINAQTKKNEKAAESPEEILIFRTSPGIEDQAEGWFRFQVSTFSPIRVVKVNGFAQMVPEGVDWAEYEIPYYLKQGKNLFTILVLTETGQAEQEFIVNYEPLQKKEKAPPPFNGVVILGQTNSDNILAAQDGKSKTSAAKNDILLSAAYAFGLNDESNVSLKGILKFDRHQNRNLVAEEVLFRQLSTEYRHKNLLGMEFNTGLGQIVISVKDANPSNPYKAGEFREDIRSMFLFLAGKIRWGKIVMGSFKIQADSQNKVKTNAEDGALTLASLGAKIRWGELRFHLLGDSRSTKFEEASKDYQSTLINAGTTYLWSPWIFGLNFQINNQQYKNADPSTNQVLQNKKDKVSVKSKYSFSSSTVVSADLKQIKQASNDATRAYKENQLTLQYIWMF